MPIVDVQVHAYEADHAARPWVDHLAGPAHVTGDEMVAAMDAVGVDGAILVSPFSLYRYDASYAQQVYAAHPTRFALVKPVDTADRAVSDTIAAWAVTPGAVAIRIMLNQIASTDPADPGIKRTLTAAAQHDLPVNMLVWGRLEQARALAEQHPDTIIVIDHLGIQQPFQPPPPTEPWAELPNVLALAKYANIRLKISGACTLSQEAFPYDDIWGPILQIIDAFGIDRCMWGTDWTRAVEFLTYEQGVAPFRTTAHLSDTDRAKLMGGTLQQVYRWAPMQSAP